MGKRRQTATCERNGEKSFYGRSALPPFHWFFHPAPHRVYASKGARGCVRQGHEKRRRRIRAGYAICWNVARINCSRPVARPSEHRSRVLPRNRPPPISISPRNASRVLTGRRRRRRRNRRSSSRIDRRTAEYNVLSFNSTTALDVTRTFSDGVRV